jgi:hypothetical protein
VRYHPAARTERRRQEPAERAVTRARFADLAAISGAVSTEFNLNGYAIERMQMRSRNIRLSAESRALRGMCGRFQL